MPGPEGLADVSLYLTSVEIYGKVRYHPAIVTDVTLEAAQGMGRHLSRHGTSNVLTG
jgi:hypothetical protein